MVKNLNVSRYIILLIGMSANFMQDLSSIGPVFNLINIDLIKPYLIFYFLFTLDLSIYFKKAVAHLEWKVLKQKCIHFIVLKLLSVKIILFICINCISLYHMKRNITKYLENLVYYLPLNLTYTLN